MANGILGSIDFNENPDKRIDEIKKSLEVISSDISDIKGRLPKESLNVSKLKPKVINNTRYATGCFASVAIGITMLAAIRSCNRAEYITENLQKLEVQTRNVIGNKAPDRFYEIDGKRVYLEIDGKPVEEYFK